MQCHRKPSVHCSRVDDPLPAVIQDLVDTGVEIRGDRDVCNLFPGVRAADEADWDTEYNDLILSVKIVDSLDEAIELSTCTDRGIPMRL